MVSPDVLSVGHCGRETVNDDVKYLRSKDLLWYTMAYAPRRCGERVARLVCKFCLKFFASCLLHWSSSVACCRGACCSSMSTHVSM